MLFAIRNAEILSPLRRLHGTVVVKDGVIVGVHSRVDLPAEAQVIDAEGLYLSPGFVDIHVHGGGGCGVMSGDAQAIGAMCRAHARFGTTSLLPTTLAAPMDKLLRAIDAVREAQTRPNDGAQILGIHLEGPFLSPKQAGAQSPESLLLPTEEHIRALLDRWDGIRMMGAAPELPGALELGRRLRARGITASIAHSDATYDEVVSAAEHGYSDITHLYSGCSTVIRQNGYRVPGVVEAGLLREDLTVQIIADLRHLPAPLLELIYRCKGAERVSLITDGLDYSAASLTEGTVYTQENGVQTVYEDGVMKLMDRQAFAGSVATSNRLVRNMVEAANAPLLDAVRMATLTPAKVVGVADRKGLVAEGYDADLILFDRSIEVRACMIGGNLIFSEL